jgi:hypothetical protein
MAQVKDKQDMPEAFEEFDFYSRTDPNIKVTLLALQGKLKEMGRAPGSTLLSWPVEYAEKRGLKSKNGVVMPAYGRLMNAYKWLIKLEASKPAPSLSADLPF